MDPTTLSPFALLAALFITVLAAFVGYEVVSKVPTMLHTPLMSGANAVHGVIVVGAMLVAATSVCFVCQSHTTTFQRGAPGARLGAAEQKVTNWPLPLMVHERLPPFACAPLGVTLTRSVLRVCRSRRKMSSA